MNSNRDEHLVSIPLTHEPHSGLVSGGAVHYVGQAEVGLLPKSLPDAHTPACCVMNPCEFGMKQTQPQKNFIKAFYGGLMSQWGTDSAMSISGTDPVIKRRLSLLKLFCDNFILSNTHLPKFQDFVFYEQGSGAAYYPAFHHIGISFLSLRGPLDGMLRRSFCQLLYHEVRHAEQCLYIARFMLSRGQTPSNQFVDEVFEAAKRANQLPADQLGGLVNRKYPFYHCIARWYAGMYGDPSSEVDKALYEDKDFPIDKSLNAAERNKNQAKLNDVISRREAAHKKLESFFDRFEPMGTTDPQEARKKDPSGWAAYEKAKAEYQQLDQEHAPLEALYRAEPMETDAYECGDRVKFQIQKMQAGSEI